MPADSHGSPSHRVEPAPLGAALAFGLVQEFYSLFGGVDLRSSSPRSCRRSRCLNQEAKPQPQPIISTEPRGEASERMPCPASFVRSRESGTRLRALSLR